MGTNTQASFNNFPFPLNHGYALLMWTYFLYFNLLSIGMVNSVGCWKMLICQCPL